MRRALAVPVLASTLLFLGSAVAHATDDKDCKNPDWAPAPMPGFDAKRCTDRAWAPLSVRTSKGQQTVEGRRSTVTFYRRDDAKNPTAAEVRDYYIAGVKKTGATVEHQDGYDAAFHRAAADGDWWYLYEHGNGNENSTGSYTLTALHVEPLAQEVETRPMSGDLDASGACTDPAWVVKQFSYFKRRADCYAKAWDSEDFDLPSGMKTVSGRHVSVSYELADDSKMPVSAALQLNILNALRKSGATIEKGDRPGYSGTVIATQKTGAGEFWMLWDPGSGNDDNRHSYTLETWQITPLEQEVVARVPPADAAAAPISPTDCKDPAWLVKQFSYFKLSHCNDRDFDSVRIKTKDGDKTLAGRVHEEVYTLTDEKKNPVSRAVWTNYVEALKKIGAELASDPKRDEEAALVRKTPDGDVWYWWEHGSGNQKSTTSYSLLTIEPPVKAACKTEVYGVNFDFDKSDIRPDSEPVLQSVLALFQKDATLKAEIGGHTDDVGQPAHNQTLSEQRAAAVKAWLVAHGIAGDRLTTHGYGDTKPLVPNKDDASRAKNRRVELTRENCSR